MALDVAGAGWNQGDDEHDDDDEDAAEFQFGQRDHGRWFFDLDRCSCALATLCVLKVR